jgi:hypothetical protein
MSFVRIVFALAAAFCLSLPLHAQPRPAAQPFNYPLDLDEAYIAKRLDRNSARPYYYAGDEHTCDARTPFILTPQTAISVEGEYRSIEAAGHLDDLNKKYFGVDGRYAAIIALVNNTLQQTIRDSGLQEVNTDSFVARPTRGGVGKVFFPTKAWMDRFNPASAQMALSNFKNQRIWMTGSGSVFAVGQYLSYCYMKSKPAEFSGEFLISIEGSGATVRNLCKDVLGESAAAIGMASDPIALTSFQSFGGRCAGREVIEFKIANDMVVIATTPAVLRMMSSQNNQAISADMKREQLCALFRDGRSPVPVFFPGKESGTVRFFYRQICGSAVPLDDVASVTWSKFDNYEYIASQIARRNGIGILPWSFYNSFGKSLTAIKIGGVEPVPANIDNNRYPLSRKLYWYVLDTTLKSNSFVREFVADALDRLPSLLANGYYLPVDRRDAACNQVLLRASKC